MRKEPKVIASGLICFAYLLFLLPSLQAETIETIPEEDWPMDSEPCVGLCEWDWGSLRFTTPNRGGFAEYIQWDPDTTCCSCCPLQNFIEAPAISGSIAHLDEPFYDVRIDFRRGAVGLIRFGFATFGYPDFGTIDVFDANGKLIATDRRMTEFTTLSNGGRSLNPENRMRVSFRGIASYALLNFYTADGYIISLGNFKSIDADHGAVVPEPSTLILFSAGLLALIARSLAVKRGSR